MCLCIYSRNTPNFISNTFGLRTESTNLHSNSTIDNYFEIFRPDRYSIINQRLYYLWGICFLVFNVIFEKSDLLSIIFYYKWVLNRWSCRRQKRHWWMEYHRTKEMIRWLRKMMNDSVTHYVPESPNIFLSSLSAHSISILLQWAQPKLPSNLFLMTQIDEECIKLSKNLSFMLRGKAQCGEDLRPTQVPWKVQFATSDRLPPLMTCRMYSSAAPVGLCWRLLTEINYSTLPFEREHPPEPRNMTCLESTAKRGDTKHWSGHDASRVRRTIRLVAVVASLVSSSELQTGVAERCDVAICIRRSGTAAFSSTTQFATSTNIPEDIIITTAPWTRCATTGFLTGRLLGDEAGAQETSHSHERKRIQSDQSAVPAETARC